MGYRARWREVVSQVHKLSYFGSKRYLHPKVFAGNVSFFVFTPLKMVSPYFGAGGYIKSAPFFLFNCLGSALEVCSAR